MFVEVTVPGEYLGSVIGDLNSRRGKIQEMVDQSGAKVVTAHVPLAAMFGYAGDLRSSSQGRGTFTMQLKHYAEVR